MSAIEAQMATDGDATIADLVLRQRILTRVMKGIIVTIVGVSLIAVIQTVVLAEIIIVVVVVPTLALLAAAMMVDHLIARIERDLEVVLGPPAVDMRTAAAETGAHLALRK